MILVDLAGSENMREVQHRIETTWVGDKPSMMKFLKEARLQTQAINKALFSLQTCIQEIAKAIKRAGANGTKLAIPRKAFPSLLTKLLATALKPCVLSPIGGVDSTETPKASRIMMVCCIAAAGTWRDTTMASLGFASECMKIKLEDPAQIALKLPLIEMLQAKKDDLTDLQHECEVFLDECVCVAFFCSPGDMSVTRRCFCRAIVPPPCLRSPFRVSRRALLGRSSSHPFVLHPPPLLPFVLLLLATTGTRRRSSFSLKTTSRRNGTTRPWSTRKRSLARTRRWRVRWPRSPRQQQRLAEHIRAHRMRCRS